MKHIHVTLVVLPEVLGHKRSEVVSAFIEDGGCEAEEATRVQVPVAVLRPRFVSLAGQTVLLHCALQEEELLVLEMGRAHQLQVVNQQVSNS